MVDLKGKNIKNLIDKKGAALIDVRQKFPNVVIHVDILKRKIELRGPTETLLKVEKELGKYTIEIVKEAQFHEQECSICFGNLIDSYTLHNCKHKFCFSCLQYPIRTAETDINALPILCSDISCRKPLALVDIRNLCSIESLKKICKLAFKQYLITNPKLYQSCPTPNCEQIYRVKESEKNFICDICQKGYCTLCREVSHGSIACDKVKDENDLKKLGLKRCPSCQVVIQKIDGCNHIDCQTCRKHFCWICADEIYETGPLCYKHLQEKHGSFI